MTAFVLPLAAQAQSASTTTAAQADAPDNGLGEIVVTATRTAEPLQKVPISIQALNASTLEQRQVKGLTDFAALLPSVSFSGIGPGRNTPYFRGIVPAGGANYASVGFYLDDIPISGESGTGDAGLPDVHIYDVERIEALSGPQGTLYGAGSLAGTIRVITNKPKIGVWEGGYDIEANKYGSGNFGGQIESYLNVPVTDNLAVRMMGYYQHDGGYIDNKPNNGKFNNGASSTLTLGDNNPATSYTLNNAAIAKDNYNPVYAYGGRIEALYEPAPGWEISPQAMGQRQIAYGYFGYDPRVGDLQVHDYDLTRQDDKWYQAQLSIHGHIGDWDIVSATGYFSRKINLRNDYSYYTVTYDGFGAGYESYLQFFNKQGCTGTGAAETCTSLLNPTQYYHSTQYKKKFTQELRLKTPSSWPFDITVGGFYQRQSQESNTYYAIHGLDSIEGYTEAGGGDVSGGLIGVPAMYGIADGQFDTSNVVNPNGNPNGTMLLGSEAVKQDGFYVVEQNLLLHDEAVFAEGHYGITPKLKITGGIRYFWTDSALVGFAGVASSAQSSAATYVPTGASGCTLPLPAARLQCLNTNPLAADQTQRYKENGETHKIVLNWQFTPSKMVYVNYSTGFRPGGTNRPLRIRTTGITVGAPPYASEKLTNFEFGLKTKWNNKFQFNAALYYEKWDNIQYGVVVAGAQGAGYTGNAGKANVYGVEYDADLKLGKVTLSSSGSYNNAKLNGNFCNFAVDPVSQAITQLATCTLGQNVGGTNTGTPQVAAADGTRLPRQPRFKGTTTIRYDTEFSGYRGYILGSANYQTSATQDLNVSDNNLLSCRGGPDAAAAATAAGIVCTTPGFISFDFGAGIRKDNWHLDIFIQNAFDRRGILTTNTFCSITFCAGSSRDFAIKPQFFGIKFGQSF